MLIFVVVMGLNVYLYIVIPKGFFPQQDTGRVIGIIQADQSISFQLMQQKLAQFVGIIKKDPAVETVVGFTGGGQTNGGFMFMSLVPLSERKISADGVIARLRRQMAVVPGATLFLQAVQDIRVGGRASNAQYQFTLQGADPGRADRMGAEDRGRPAGRTQPRRRQQRPAEQGAGSRSRDQSRRRRPAWHHRQPDRQHALRCLRPAPGLDHLCRAQPVSRDHGGGAALLAEPGNAEGRLCLDLRRLGRRLAGDQRRGGNRGRARRRRPRQLPPMRRPRAISRPIRSAPPARVSPRPDRRSAPSRRP